MQFTKTYVDASFATHPDMKSHTGGVFTLGRGITHHKSSKQKLNTKSSTEAEIVGASDYVAYTLWLSRFLEQQGYSTKENIFYQDNESAMKLEKNGSASASNRSRHIHIRYFFIKDLVDSKQINIKHCPTERMVADFLTKPLQGTLFVKFRDIIMGTLPFPMEERVEKMNTNEELKISIGNGNDNSIDEQANKSSSRSNGCLEVKL